MRTQSPKKETRSLPKKTVLHVGCGPQSVFGPEDGYDVKVMQCLAPADWQEIRVDLDTNVEPPPDVIADAADLPFEDESADALVCLACLEHLTEWNASRALQEFHRVLKVRGMLILQVPDLLAAAKMIVEGKLCEVLYDSDAGPVRALDLIYGHQLMTPNIPLMTHRTGFTSETLAYWLWEVGFDGKIERWGHDLWSYTTKTKEHEGERNGCCLYQRTGLRDPQPVG